jgi:hypothetical protein
MVSLQPMMMAAAPLLASSLAVSSPMPVLPPVADPIKPFKIITDPPESGNYSYFLLPN